MTVAIDLISALAQLASLCIGLAPWSAMMEVRRKRDIGSHSMFPFLGMVMAGFLWSIYGILADQLFPVTSTNLPLGVLGLFYCNIYSTYAPMDKRICAVAQLLAVLGVIAIVAILAVTNEGSTSLERALGIMGCISSIALYAAPLVSVHTMIKTRSLEHMCFPLVVAIAASTTLWTAYAILVDDPWICATNVVGLALACLQIAAFVSVRFECSFPSSGVALTGNQLGAGGGVPAGAHIFDSPVKATQPGGTIGKGPAERWPLLQPRPICTAYGTDYIELGHNSVTAPPSEDDDASPPRPPATALRLWPSATIVEGLSAEESAGMAPREGVDYV